LKIITPANLHKTAAIHAKVYQFATHTLLPTSDDCETIVPRRESFTAISNPSCGLLVAAGRLQQSADGNLGSPPVCWGEGNLVSFSRA
jgi:hypothetical protein